MTLRDHLEAIKEKRGKLTPRLIVEEAHDPKHPLHHRFEWDDRIAGEAWRHEQARMLIKEVSVSYLKADGSRESIRGYYSIQREDGFQYESVDDLQADPVSREIVLAQMQREWVQLKERYENFKEFWELIEKSRVH